MNKYDDLCNRVADIKHDLQIVLDELYSLQTEEESLTIKQLRERNDKLKSEGAILAERIDEMKEAAFADANTIKHLKDKLDEEEERYDDGEWRNTYSANFIRRMSKWLDRRPESENDGKTIDQLIQEFKEAT